MRIAFHAPMKALGDAKPSGDARVARLLVEALERAGATVDLPSALKTYDRGDPARQARLERLGGRCADRLIARYRGGGLDRPDLWFTYHLYHKAPDHLGPAVSEALAIPYVVGEASHAPKQAGGRWDVGFRAAERGIRAADRIYCLNPVDAACLAPLVKHPGVLMDLAPFIDTAPFRQAEDQRRAARLGLATEFGLDPDVPLLLTVAMMREDQKLASYVSLADALGRLGGRGWSLLVVGAGPAEARVRQAFAAFGQRVRFAGLRQGADLVRAYAGADVFVWPAVKEAFGMAFVEAAAAGLAIVAGRSGGIAHIVEDGVTGLVVAPGDAEAMAEALKRLLDDPVRMRAMGERGARRASEVNDIAAAARTLGADLQGILSRHRGAP